MKIKPIHTADEYREVLNRMKEVFDAQKGSPEDDELELLSILIESHEEYQFPINLPDPVEAIRFRM